MGTLSYLFAIFISILSSIIFIVAILYSDRESKEPNYMIVLALLSGIFTIAVSLIVGQLILPKLNFLNGESYNFIKVLIFAFVEETAKIIVLYFCIQRNSNFDDNLRYLLNWVTHFSITKEQVEKEKGIILEEASMYKDVPDRILYEKLSQNIYVNHPYKDKVIGTDSDIKSITKSDSSISLSLLLIPSHSITSSLSLKPAVSKSLTGISIIVVYASM